MFIELAVVFILQPLLRRADTLLYMLQKQKQCRLPECKKGR